MANFKFVVLSNPVEGREREYNEWYSGRHIKDVVETSGFVSAQRFSLATTEGGGGAHQYLAIYEIEAEDAGEAVKALFARGASGEMPMSDAIDVPGIVSGVFEPIEGASAP